MSDKPVPARWRPTKTALERKDSALMSDLQLVKAIEELGSAEAALIEIRDGYVCSGECIVDGSLCCRCVAAEALRKVGL